MKLELNHHGKLTWKIIGLATRVHGTLGPKLLESVYRRCLCHELRLADIPFEQEVYLPIHYNGIDIESGYRADIIVRKQVRLELKAVEQLGPLHEAQLLTYLRIQPMPARSADELQHPVAGRPPPGGLTAALPYPVPPESNKPGGRKRTTKRRRRPCLD